MDNILPVYKRARVCCLAASRPWPPTSRTCDPTDRTPLCSVCSAACRPVAVGGPAACLVLAACGWCVAGAGAGPAAMVVVLEAERPAGACRASRQGLPSCMRYALMWRRC